MAPISFSLGLARPSKYVISSARLMTGALLARYKAIFRYKPLSIVEDGQQVVVLILVRGAVGELGPSLEALTLSAENFP